ncbi:MAG: 2Fe-2S iron-sulfur cluster-binding protein [Thalassobaculaceae bacterium]
MAEFHPLTVTDLARDTADAVVVTLRPPAEVADRFAYQPGQYLTFKQNFDGVELRRAYSICASRRDNRLRVAIKRVSGGGFSTWANETLRVGDTLGTMAPAGRFTAAPDPAAAKTYLGLAAGSGITPVLGIMKTLLEDEPQSRFYLIYGNRSVNSILFRDEIDDLKNLHMTRLSITHVLSQGGDLAALSGRLDAAKCAHFFDHLVDPARLDQAYLCGPEGLIDTARTALTARGLAPTAIHYELFAGAGQSGRLAARPAVAADADPWRATVVLNGVRQTIAVDAATSVLAAARAAGLDAPYSCQAGVCATCRAQVTDGTYTLASNHALEDYETAAGYVLTCQCFPEGDGLKINYDK